MGGIVNSMNNAERFKSLVDELLMDDPKYQNELNNFISYLKDRRLEDKVFNLNVTHIDEYFVYSFDAKIGAVPTLTTHISALKKLFDFLIRKEIDFKSLYGYIDTAGFKERLSEKLVETFKKPIMDSSLLNSTLYKMDVYIDSNINKSFKNISTKKRFFEILICRIYAKLNLILPLKPAEMLELKLYDIQNDNVRSILHNGINIKIPNSLRTQIVQTINFTQKNFGKSYSESDKLFCFLYNAINKRASTSSISNSFTKTYTDLEIHEMLKQRPGGKKDKYIYPSESYKITAISSMLENGTNILYLKKLTGLDMGTLTADFDFQKETTLKDNISIEINNGIVNSEYFTYL